MCSIIGAAGPINKLPRKLQAEFHEFLSCLFTMGELRGRDASGFWVWRNTHYVAEKRPIPAEDLIQRSPRWKGLRFTPGSLYIMHTRAATDGDPNENINNHPHIGKHSVMIHNGMIWGFRALISQYNLSMKTDCDSEVLLRLAECCEDLKAGLKFMYEATNDSTGTDNIATAFVDRRNPDKIFLSRNMGSPCHLFHSKKFGCTFFVSTELIFERALQMLYKTKNLNVIGAKAESVDAHHLYLLNADGSHTKEFLVKPKSMYSSSQNYFSDQSFNSPADEETSQHYIVGTLYNQEMSVDIMGNMNEINVDDTETELLLDEPDDLVDAMVMPANVEVELRQYLNQRIKEGNY